MSADDQISDANSDILNPQNGGDIYLSPQQVLQTRHNQYLHRPLTNPAIQNLFSNLPNVTSASTPITSTQSLSSAPQTPTTANNVSSASSLASMLSNTYTITGAAVTSAPPTSSAQVPDLSTILPHLAQLVYNQSLQANTGSVQHSSAHTPFLSPQISSSATIATQSHLAGIPSIPALATAQPAPVWNPVAPPPVQMTAPPTKPNVLNLTLLTGNCPVQRNAVSQITPAGAIEKFHKNCPRFNGFSRNSYEVFSHFDKIEAMFASYQIAPTDYYQAASHSFEGAAYAYFRQNDFVSYNDLKTKIIKIYGQSHTTNQLRKEFHQL